MSQGIVDVGRGAVKEAGLEMRRVGDAHRLVARDTSEYALRRHPTDPTKLVLVHAPTALAQRVRRLAADPPPLHNRAVDADHLADVVSAQRYTKEDMYARFDVHPSKHRSVVQSAFSSFYIKCFVVMVALFAVNVLLTLSLLDSDICRAELLPATDAEYHKVDLTDPRMRVFGAWRREMALPRSERAPERAAARMMASVLPEVTSTPLASLVVSDPATRHEFDRLSLHMPSGVSCRPGVHVTRAYALYVHVFKVVWTAHFSKIKMYQEIGYTSPYERSLGTADERAVATLLTDAGVAKDDQYYPVMYRVILWEYGATYFTSAQVRRVHAWLRQRSVFDKMVAMGDRYGILFAVMLLVHSIVSRLMEPIYWIRILIEAFVRNGGVYERYLAATMDVPFVHLKHTLYSIMHQVHSARA